MKKISILFILMMVVSLGCKQRVVTQPESQQQSSQRDQQAEGQKDMSQDKKTPESVTERKLPAEGVESSERTSLSSEQREGMFKDVLFDFDKYTVQDSFKPELKNMASWLLKNSDAKLSIEGHCDDRGTKEYNLALGERRAKAVKDYLLSMGVGSARIETISYGEEKPLCTEQTEECWAKNRRAHFIILGRSKK